MFPMSVTLTHYQAKVEVQKMTIVSRKENTGEPAAAVHNQGEREIR